MTQRETASQKSDLSAFKFNLYAKKRLEAFKHASICISDEFKLRQALEIFEMGPVLDQIVLKTWPEDLIKKKNLIKTSLSWSRKFKGDTDLANPDSNTSIPHSKKQ